jgi:hypothetical protein
MKGVFFCLVLTAAAGAARADDRSDCVDGIAMLRAEVPKAAAAIKGRLERELRIAEREQGEGEFDECVDAIRAARKAMGR